MENLGKGLLSTKIFADKLAENTPKCPKIVCLSQKVWYFNEKRLHFASVVRNLYLGRLSIFIFILF